MTSRRLSVATIVVAAFASAAAAAPPPMWDNLVRASAKTFDSVYILPGALPPVRGDRLQLQQVVLNLIRNAIDACRSTPADAREVP